MAWTRLTTRTRSLVVAALIAVGLLGALFAGAAGAATVTLTPGETLSHVAARHGTSVEQLAAANGIGNPDQVVAGTRLAVAGGTGTSAAASSGISAGTHRVAAGETLSGIAARYGTSAEALARANGISVDGILAIGTRLAVAGASGGPTSDGDGAPASTAAGTHRVAAGETLSGIAARYGTSAEALAGANGLSDADVVVIGALLQVPSGAAAPSSAPARAASDATSIGGLLDSASARHGVPADLSRAIAWQESGWKQSARSSVGAIGVMQLMPTTAEWFGPAVLGRSINPYSVGDNVDTGVAYLAYLTRQLGDPSRAVGAYYRGPNAVRRYGLGTETQAYVSNVMALRGTV